MTARQRGMSVDEVNPILSVEPPHLCQQTPIEPSSSARQADIPRNLRISHPIRRSHRQRLSSTMVHRGDRDDAGSNATLFKPPDRFRDEATAYFIAGGGEKWRQRQNMKRGLPFPGCRRNIGFGVRYLWAQRSHPFDAGCFRTLSLFLRSSMFLRSSIPISLF